MVHVTRRHCGSCNTTLSLSGVYHCTVGWRHITRVDDDDDDEEDDDEDDVFYL